MTEEDREGTLDSASDLLRSFARNRVALGALVFLIVITLAAVFANYLFPAGPSKYFINDQLEAPSLAHPFGTDYLGRNMLMLIAYGARTDLLVAFAAGGLIAVLGTLSGLVAGYYGGRVDGILMRIVDIFLTLPTLPLILVVVAVAQPSLLNIFLVIALTGWPGMARLVRSNVLALAKQEFIQIERVMGAGTGRIIFRHLLPNMTNVILVYTSLVIPVVILTEATIEFLGLAPLSLSWGFLINISLSYMIQGAWWMSVFPGLAIFGTSLSFYLISEGLKGALTPKLRRRGESIAVQLAEEKR
ncbi:MAG: ABC transporter permease [Nitrososphaerales archaeon]|jgi:ABC-type dipeptide/oligopeptide/nickel transport system permease subunit